VPVSTHPLESEWIKRAVRGDESAFESLYRFYLDFIYTLVLRMTGDAHKAEDITQEVFVRLWRNIGKFRGQSSFRTWFYRLAMNVILREESRYQKKCCTTIQDDFPAPEGDLAPRILLRYDLEKAIALLPLRCRGVLVLSELMGYNHREIGKIMKISPGTSKAHLHKAKALLRKELER
jgi:RNA polymerase sigma factor (sigma-70 family)